MTDARAFHTATLLLNGKVLLACGLTDNTGSLSSTADIFDPNAGINGTFTTSASIPGSRAAAASVLFPSGPMAGKVLITDGDVCTGTGEVCSGKTIDVYDPDTGIFSFPIVMNDSG